MTFAMRKRGNVSLAILSVVCASVVIQAFGQQAESVVSSQYLELDHTSSSQLTPADLT